MFSYSDKKIKHVFSFCLEIQHSNKASLENEIKEQIQCIKNSRPAAWSCYQVGSSPRECLRARQGSNQALRGGAAAGTGGGQRTAGCMDSGGRQAEAALLSRHTRSPRGCGFRTHCPRCPSPHRCLPGHRAQRACAQTGPRPCAPAGWPPPEQARGQEPASVMKFKPNKART